MKEIKTFFQIFNFISPQPDNINESDDEYGKKWMPLKVQMRPLEIV